MKTLICRISTLSHIPTFSTSILPKIHFTEKSTERGTETRRRVGSAARGYQRCRSYQNSGRGWEVASLPRGTMDRRKKNRTSCRRSVSRMASTPYISIDIYVYTCIGAQLSTGSYFPVRHRVVVLVWSSRPVQLLMYSPTRITSSSLAHFSHFKCPLSFIFSPSSDLPSLSLPPRTASRVYLSDTILPFLRSSLLPSPSLSRPPTYLTDWIAHVRSATLASNDFPRRLLPLRYPRSRDSWHTHEEIR